MSIRIFILIAFLINSIGPMPAAYAQEFNLPKPGVMVHLSPPMNPAILKGIKVDPNNPFRFDFIMDVGDGSPVPNKDDANRLIKYFLASLTIPEQDLWVNLSPYEKDRIIPNSFGLTEMGRDLLAEDYMLKQITASLIYPEDEVGKKFWKRIYEEAAARYGTTNIPVNTFNKVWIVPEKAVVYENAPAGTAYVVESRLKVMLEGDYLAMNKNVGVGSKPTQMRAGLEPAPTETNQIGSQIIREIVIPELTKEINEGQNFAQLRQVYNSLILATWYKKKIKDSILSQVYVDKNKIVGVGSKPTQMRAGLEPAPTDVEFIYQRYLTAFKKGVYNYIKEEADPVTQQAVPRKYFSGGADLALTASKYGLGEVFQIREDLPLNVNVSPDNAMIVSSILKGLKNADNARLSNEDFVEHFNNKTITAVIYKRGTKIQERTEVYSVSAREDFAEDDLLPRVFVSLKRISDGKEFNDVLVFLIDQGEVQNVYINLTTSQDISGQGLGSALYRMLIERMSEGMVLKELIQNPPTLEKLKKEYEAKGRGDKLVVIQKETNKKVVEKLPSELADNEISLQTVLSETLMGSLLVQAGLTELEMELATLTGVRALAESLRGSVLGAAHSFNLKARKPIAVAQVESSISQDKPTGADEAMVVIGKKAAALGLGPILLRNKLERNKGIAYFFSDIKALKAEIDSLKGNQISFSISYEDDLYKLTYLEGKLDDIRPEADEVDRKFSAINGDDGFSPVSQSLVRKFKEKVVDLDKYLSGKSICIIGPGRSMMENDALLKIAPSIGNIDLVESDLSNVKSLLDGFNNISEEQKKKIRIVRSTIGKFNPSASSYALVYAHMVFEPEVFGYNFEKLSSLFTETVRWLEPNGFLLGVYDSPNLRSLLNKYFNNISSSFFDIYQRNGVPVIQAINSSIIGDTWKGRHKNIDNFLAPLVFKFRDFLEVGLGENGAPTLSEWGSKLNDNQKLYGIDANEEFVRLAQEENMQAIKNGKLVIRKGILGQDESLFNPGSLDMVRMFNVIQYYSHNDQKKIRADIRDLLRIGGFYIEGLGPFYMMMTKSKDGFILDRLIIDPVRFQVMNSK